MVAVLFATIANLLNEARIDPIAGFNEITRVLSFPFDTSGSAKSVADAGFSRCTGRGKPDCFG